MYWPGCSSNSQIDERPDRLRHPTPAAAPLQSDMTSNDDAAASIAERVRKLLAMAERTTNPAEADAFSAKAAELIARHRLTPEVLRPPDPDQLALREVVIGRGAYVRARLALLVAVATPHGGFVTFRSTDTGTVAAVCGHRSDLDAIAVLYTSLLAQMSARAAQQHRSTGAATQRWRRSFMFGFAHQIEEMLRRAHANAVAAASSDDLVPALRARDAAVREFASHELGPIVTARRAAPVGADAVRSGRAAANDVDIGRSRLGGRRAIGSGR